MKKRSTPPKRYLGRQMESEWLLGADGLEHAYRHHGRDDYAELSECRQAIRLIDDAAPPASRCVRCVAIMALPGMNERRRETGE